MNTDAKPSTVTNSDLNNTAQPITIDARVFISSRHGTTLTTIERETKTQWVTKTGDRFNKRSLRLIGETDAWCHTQLSFATDEDIAAFRRQIAHKKLARKLAETKWSALSLEALQAVDRALTLTAITEQPVVTHGDAPR